jgi:hypothetical protein
MFGLCFSKRLVLRKKKSEEQGIKSNISLPVESQITSEESLPCFPSFAKLPTELRLKIWNATIEPRVIFMLPRIRTTVPIILQVCKESRAEGLLEYHILTYPSVNHEVPGIEGRNNIDNWSGIYFKKTIDILFYGESPLGSRDYQWSVPWTELPTTVLQVHHIALSRFSFDKLRSPPPYAEHLRDVYDRALQHNSLRTIAIVEDDFWSAIEINKNPEVLSGTEVRLVFDKDGPFRAENSEAWLDYLLRLDSQSNVPVLKFATLERYATSRFDTQRVRTGRCHSAFCFHTRKTLIRHLHLLTSSFPVGFI